MIHAREDYARIQDPAQSDPYYKASGINPIGIDEPVMLFRAQDKHFVKLLHRYWEMLNADEQVNPNPETRRVMDAVSTHMKVASDWRRTHTMKTPDLRPEEPTSDA